MPDAAFSSRMPSALQFSPIEEIVADIAA